MNGAYPSSPAPGQVVDANLYYRFNPNQTAPLLGGFDTVAELFADTGFEERGLGAVAGRGTDPGFDGLSLLAEDPSAQRWQFTAASEAPHYSDFAPGAGSPVIGAAIPLPAGFPGETEPRDIGAIAFGQDLSEYEGFPFDPGGPVVPPPDAGTVMDAGVTADAGSGNGVGEPCGCGGGLLPAPVFLLALLAVRRRGGSSRATPSS